MWKEINPGVWKPTEENDSIEGIVVGREVDHQELSNKYYLKTKDEGIVLVWGSTILDQRFTFISDGELVRIRYKGQETNKKGQPLNIYSVEVYEDEKKGVEEPKE